MSLVSTGLKYIGRSINAHYTGTTLKPPKIKRSLTQKPIYSAAVTYKNRCKQIADRRVRPCKTSAFAN